MFLKKMTLSSTSINEVTFPAHRQSENNHFSCPAAFELNETCCSREAQQLRLSPADSESLSFFKHVITAFKTVLITA